MREEFGDTRGMKLTYMGKEQGNVSDSLMVICAKLGINFCSCGPKGDVEGATHFDPELLERCQEIAAQNGCTIQLTEDIDEGVKDADVIYTDVWVGMGQAEELWKSRIDLLSPYQVRPRSWPRQTPAPSLCTACRASTIRRPPSARDCREVRRDRDGGFRRGL